MMAVRQRTSGLLILLLSMGAGLLAALLAVGYLRGVEETQPVLVARQEIPPFTPLSPSLFRTERWPARAVPPDALTDLSTLAGRYARGLILEGAVMRAAYLATASGDAGSLAARLTEAGDPNARALAIPIDPTTGVGGTLQPGDRVDLIAAVKVEREKAPPVTIAKTIARAVPVLHRTAEAGSDKATVVLMVTDDVAEEIAYAQLAGTIYLATNPYQIDASAPPTEGVTPESFLKRHAGR
jgi:pilus assembly protein CpaB